MDSLLLGSTAVAAVGLGSYFAGKESNDTPREVLSASRIKSYPFLAGASLIGIQVMLEYLGPKRVNYLFMYYFGLAGTNSIWFLLRAFFKMKSRKLFYYPSSKSILTEFVLPNQRVPFFLHDIPLYLIALIVNVAYYQTRNNIANNIIAFSIAFFAILSIRIEKFTSAAPLLWSLLIYDVFFVYQTDVMTSVAMGLEGPVKLQVNLRGRGNSVLGLGDIVIPGLFIAVCSRFDTFLNKVTGRRSYYWLTGLIFYSIAMGVTDLVCYITKKGQPALLFITPLVTVPIVLMALIRREHLAFASYSG